MAFGEVDPGLTARGGTCARWLCLGLRHGLEPLLTVASPELPAMQLALERTL